MLGLESLLSKSPSFSIIIFVCKDTIFVGKKKIKVKNIIKQLVLFFVFLF